MSVSGSDRRVQSTLGTANNGCGVADPLVGSAIDSLSVSTVGMVAERVAALAGFAVVRIVAFTDLDRLEVVARVGVGHGRIRRFDRSRQMAWWTSELASAEDCDGLLFVTQEVAGGSGEVSAGGVDSLWKPGDLLIAPLHDAEKMFVGFLCLDEPTDGRRPNPATRAAVSELAVEAGLIVGLAVRRRELGDQVRLVSAVSAVVRQASREDDLMSLMQQICRPLVAGLQACGLWLQVFEHDDPDAPSQLIVHDESNRLGQLTEDEANSARRVAEQSWDRQRVGIVSRSHLRGGLLSPGEVDRVRAFLESKNLGSLLCIPIGAGPVCLGSLILARDLDESRWTEIEIEVALVLGHDLGRAVLNVHNYRREHELVRRLQSLDAHKTMLTRTMSHELKSPLAAILANLEFIGHPADADRDTRRGLHSIERGTKRLVRLVDDLLVLSRASDPEQPMEVGPVDLAALAEDAIDLKRAETLERGIVVRVVHPERSAQVLGNAVALDLLVSNLVSNAVKYSPAGGAVTVSVESLGDGVGDRVVLTCTDQGIGMTQADQARIFEEFYRSGHQAAQSQAGTGLGLAIVERIVRRHHGTITVTSTLGEGSTFRVELPRATPLIETSIHQLATCRMEIPDN